MDRKSWVAVASGSSEIVTYNLGEFSGVEKSMGSRALRLNFLSEIGVFR